MPVLYTLLFSFVFVGCDNSIETESSTPNILSKEHSGDTHGTPNENAHHSDQNNTIKDISGQTSTTNDEPSNANIINSVDKAILTSTGYQRHFNAQTCPNDTWKHMDLSKLTVGSGPSKILSPTYNYIISKKLCVEWLPAPKATHYQILIRDLLRKEKVVLHIKDLKKTFLITDDLPLGSTYTLYVQPFIDKAPLMWSRFTFVHEPDGVPNSFRFPAQ